MLNSQQGSTPRTDLRTLKAAKGSKHTANIKSRGNKPQESTCEFCGIVFETTWAGQTGCSFICQRKAYNQKEWPELFPKRDVAASIHVGLDGINWSLLNIGWKIANSSSTMDPPD